MRDRKRSSSNVVYCFAILSSAYSLNAQDPNLDSLNLFETKIRPVLAARCYGCHSAKAVKVQGGLLLDSQGGLKRGGNSGVAIAPGDPDKSLLLRALRYQDKNLQMPPGKPLPVEVVRDFENWIRSGGAMPADSVKPIDQRTKFWSFQPPKDHLPPEVKQKGWARSDIDRFILAKLEEKGLRPSEPADARTLIRRAYFDLIGLPPTAEESEAFAADKSPDAYSRLIDRLLASPVMGRGGGGSGSMWRDIPMRATLANVLLIRIRTVTGSSGRSMKTCPTTSS